MNTPPDDPVLELANREKVKTPLPVIVQPMGRLRSSSRSSGADWAPRSGGRSVHAWGPESGGASMRCGGGGGGRAS